eukprot:gene12855-12607_t
MSLLSLQEVCFENLLLLGFGPVASERKSGRAPLHPTMFDTANKTAMQVVMRFLLHRLDPDRAQKVFKFCWPAIDRAQETQFRKGCTTWIAQLDRENPLAGLPKHAPSILLNPSGHKMYALVLKLSCLVIRKLLGRDDNAPFSDVASEPRFDLRPPSGREGARIRRKAVKIHAARLAKRFVGHAGHAVQVQHKWRTFAAELAQTWRRVNRARRAVAEEREQFPPNITSETAETVRASRIEIARGLWERVQDFADGSADGRKVLNDVVQGKADPVTLDANGIGVTPPASVLQAAEDGSPPGPSVGSCYRNGQLQLSSFVSLWNVALALIERKMAESQTSLSGAVVQNDMLCHRHQKYMHAARELQSDLRTGLLQNLGASVSVLNESIQENDIGVAWPPTPAPFPQTQGQGQGQGRGAHVPTNSIHDLFSTPDLDLENANRHHVQTPPTRTAFEPVPPPLPSASAARNCGLVPKPTLPQAGAIEAILRDVLDNAGSQLQGRSEGAGNNYGYSGDEATEEEEEKEKQGRHELFVPSEVNIGTGKAQTDYRIGSKRGGDGSGGDRAQNTDGNDVYEDEMARAAAVATAVSAATAAAAKSRAAQRFGRVPSIPNATPTVRNTTLGRTTFASGITITKAPPTRAVKVADRSRSASLDSDTSAVGAASEGYHDAAGTSLVPMLDSTLSIALPKQVFTGGFARASSTRSPTRPSASLPSAPVTSTTMHEDRTPQRVGRPAATGTPLASSSSGSVLDSSKPKPGLAALKVRLERLRQAMATPGSTVAGMGSSMSSSPPTTASASTGRAGTPMLATDASLSMLKDIAATQVILERYKARRARGTVSAASSAAPGPGAGAGTSVSASASPSRTVLRGGGSSPQRHRAQTALLNIDQDLLTARDVLRSPKMQGRINALLATTSPTRPPTTPTSATALSSTADWSMYDDEEEIFLESFLSPA